MSGSRLAPQVTRLGWVSFLTDVSSEMLYAITPIFLTTILGASASIVGLIEGIAEATASILKGASGWYSDRIRKRKVFMLAGYGLAAIAKPLIAIAGSWFFVLLARILDRFGKGIRGSARDALIADVTPPELRGRAFGLHRAMDTAGALLGVAISLFILQTYGDSGKLAILLRNLYWIAFIPALLGVLVIFLVREPRHENELKPSEVRSAPLGKAYWSIVLIASVGFLGFSSDAFLILKARDGGLSLVQVLLGYLLFNACSAAFAFPIGKLADRISKERLIALGLLIYGIVYFGFARAESQFAYLALFVLYGIYAALTDGVFKALIVNVVAPESKATAVGVFSMVTGLLALIASLVAGWMWDNFSSDAPFYLGAACAICAALGFLLLSLRRPHVQLI